MEDNFEDRLDSFLENCLERHLGGCLGGQLESYKSTRSLIFMPPAVKPRFCNCTAGESGNRANGTH